MMYAALPEVTEEFFPLIHFYFLLLQSTMADPKINANPRGMHIRREILTNMLFLSFPLWHNVLKFE